MQFAFTPLTPKTLFTLPRETSLSYPCLSFPCSTFFATSQGFMAHGFRVSDRSIKLLRVLVSTAIRFNSTTGSVVVIVLLKIGLFYKSGRGGLEEIVTRWIHRVRLWVLRSNLERRVLHYRCRRHPKWAIWCCSYRRLRMCCLAFRSLSLKVKYRRSLQSGFSLCVLEAGL